ncbi:MAG: cytochrome c peroxidase [Phycisphaerae bacterium]
MTEETPFRASFPALVLLCVLEALLVGADARGQDGLEHVARETPDKAPNPLPEIPRGLDPVPIPAGNPLTAEKIELGKLLFFDSRLSRDGTVSCATCHNPKTGWAEHRATSKGINNQVGSRNAPTVINAAYHRAQFWDGRAASLEEQALGPIENPIEMGHDLSEVVKQLSQIPEYRRRFKAAFGSGVTKEGIAGAIAAFERTILSGNSPYDRYVGGVEGAMTDAQERGMEVFMETANCSMCHTPPTFSNGRYYNAGVGVHADKPDPGRKAVTQRERDFGRFRVPSLRNVADTAPYFHDGSAKTLKDAVELMANGGIDNSNLSRMFRVIREAQLTKQDKYDLVEFLKALSGEYPIVEPPQPPEAKPGND